MKVVEATERNCCQWPHDFKRFKGVEQPAFKPWRTVWFCGHCGQLWVNHRAPGEMDAGLTRLLIERVSAD